MGEDFLKYQAPLINFNNIDYKILIPKVQNKGKIDLSGLFSAFGGSLLNSNSNDFGGAFGNIFSSAIINSGSNLISNALKGNALTEGLKSNALNSLSGSAAGLASNYLGQGISSLGGDSALSRGLGAGVANGLGTIGGAALSSLFNSGKFAANFGGKGLFSSVEGAINPYALGANIAGSILGAAAGPSKEYGGTYGNITQTMDTIYDGLNIGANFIPGAGQGISAVMSLNKGLSNIFGSTDGMTETDAILGSAFMPAPVKWLNMSGSRTTDTFNRQSWRNQEKANSFMKNSFGDLNDKFNQARSESGKTYGLFSKGAYNRANDNIRFANRAWDTILDMANQNEYQNIRSLYMSSINNQRYAQNIDGGYSSVFRGKQGMKILNNATDHNIGMRLLSAAALIDNKAMILSAQNGTKFSKSIVVKGYPLVSAESEKLTNYFKNNPNVAGMAIGAGLNGINGERRIVLNPNLEDENSKNSVYMNESYRHYFDENNPELPILTDIQRKAYKGTPYEGLDELIQRTEAARYLSGDPSHHLNDLQKAQLYNKFKFIYPK